MGILNLTDLKPGMVLEEDVITSKGTKLLPKGTELSERHLQIMSTWGVIEASVQGVTREDIAQERISDVSREDQERVQAEVDAMFAGHENDELMSEIARVVMKIKVEHLQKAKTGD